MKKIEIGDKSYPKNLLNIFEPPKVLYVMGDETILDNFGIAIVGSRNASEYGKSITKSLAYSLAKHNVNIISGMAKGIDEEAHKGALMANGKTIAVLGGGFFHIYPKENEGLFHEILRKDLNFTGVIITDDLAMGAVSTISNNAVKAIQAGNDILITTDYAKSIEEIKKAIDDGTISEELIDTLALRVISWKYYKNLMFDNSK